MTESQTAGLSVCMQAVSCRELEDRCWTYSREAKRSQMGQTLFDEPGLSGSKSRLHQGGVGWEVEGGVLGAWDWAGKNQKVLLAIASDATITGYRKRQK